MEARSVRVPRIVSIAFIIDLLVLMGVYYFRYYIEDNFDMATQFFIIVLPLSFLLVLVLILRGYHGV